MMGLVRFVLGVCLLPLCVAAVRTVADLVMLISPVETGFTPGGLALVGGFAGWLLIFLFLPRPVRSYVFAHELTHAIWGGLMGARIFDIRVSENKGSVTLSKNNFLITLAPYFFPFYTVLVLIAYAVLSIFYDMTPYHAVWLGAVGFTWGFHFTFTITTLMQHQTDIKRYGMVFSYAVIFLFNILGIALWIVAVSPVTLDVMMSCMSGHTLTAAAATYSLLLAGMEKAADYVK
jgi:hypothetical protein